MKLATLLLVVAFVFTVSVPGQDKGMPDAERYKNDPEYRRKWDDYEKKYDGVVEENKKISEKNLKIKELFDHGNAFFNQMKYEEAIAKYAEILTLSNYWVTNFTVHLNKSMSHTQLGIKLFNEYATKQRRELRSADENFKAAVADMDIVAAMVEQHKNSEDPTDSKFISDHLYKVARQRSESYRLYVYTNPRMAESAIKIIQEYLKLETNEELRVTGYLQIEELKKKNNSP